MCLFLKHLSSIYSGHILLTSTNFAHFVSDGTIYLCVIGILCNWNFVCPQAEGANRLIKN